MPRTLAIDPRVPTSHGLIIRRRTLAEQTRAHITIREARAYARRIVKQAQLHAEAIKHEAMQQGFDDGWQDSLDVMYESLRGTEQLHVQIERTLKQSVHETMEKALAQPALELQLLEGWLSAAPSAPASLNLVLPRRAQDQIPAITRLVEEKLKVTPTVSISDNDCVVIECGDQIVEFSPTRVLQETDELAKNSIRRLEVKKQCAAWSKHIVQHWLSNLAQRFEGELQHNTDEDAFDDDMFDDDDDDEDDE
jgi:hypothetical protein